MLAQWAFAKTPGTRGVQLQQGVRIRMNSLIAMTLDNNEYDRTPEAKSQQCLLF